MFLIGIIVGVFVALAAGYAFLTEPWKRIKFLRRRFDWIA